MIKYRLKNWAKTLVGHGPVKIGSFAEIFPSNAAHVACGVDTPECPGGVIKEEPSRPYTLPPLPPECLDRQMDPFRYRNGGMFVEPPRRLWLLSGAGVAGETGCVYHLKSRIAVAETLKEWACGSRLSPLLHSPRFPAATPLSGISLVAAGLGAGGFYHFLHEMIPKVLFAREYLSPANNLLCNGQAGSFHRAWLDFFNVTCARIIHLDGLAHYACDQVIFSPDLVEDMQPNPWSIRQLREQAGCFDSDEGTLLLWATRRDCKIRNPAWERALLEEFPQFQVVDFSTLAPSEAVNLCRRCKVLAGPHGAAFSNAVFCPPSGKVIEFFPENFSSPLYGRLAAVCGLSYHAARNDFTQGTLGKSLGQMKEFLKIP